ncbi:hypothetical protein ABTK30_19755, partial [Acinetobacter baumannii]
MADIHGDNGARPVAERLFSGRAAARLQPAGSVAAGGARPRQAGRHGTARARGGDMPVDGG